jgi:hypothetical protein
MLSEPHDKQAENLVEQKRKMGETVTYGHEIQLQQILSDRYLAVSMADTSSFEPKLVSIESMTGRQGMRRLTTSQQSGRLCP